MATEEPHQVIDAPGATFAIEFSRGRRDHQHASGSAGWTRRKPPQCLTRRSRLGRRLRVQFRTAFVDKSLAIDKLVTLSPDRLVNPCSAALEMDDRRERLHVYLIAARAKLETVVGVLVICR